MYEDSFWHEDEAPDPATLRRARIRRIVAIIVVVALIAAVLVPVIIRTVRRPAPPTTVVAAAIAPTHGVMQMHEAAPRVG